MDKGTDSSDRFSSSNPMRKILESGSKFRAMFINNDRRSNIWLSKKASWRKLMACHIGWIETKKNIREASKKNLITAEDIKKINQENAAWKNLVLSIKFSFCLSDTLQHLYTLPFFCTALFLVSPAGNATQNFSARITHIQWSYHPCQYQPLNDKNCWKKI